MSGGSDTELESFDEENGSWDQEVLSTNSQPIVSMQEVSPAPFCSQNIPPLHYFAPESTNFSEDVAQTRRTGMSRICDLRRTSRPIFGRCVRQLRRGPQRQHHRLDEYFARRTPQPMQIDSPTRIADSDSAEDGDLGGNAPEVIVLDSCDSDLEEVLAISEEASGVPEFPTAEHAREDENTSSVEEKTTVTCTDGPNCSARSTRTEEEESDICSICLEPWTNVGPHRMCNLRCGHVFGYNCVIRWFNTAKKCPQCNRRAKKSDVRPVYVSTLRAIDTVELESLKKELEKERELRMSCQQNAQLHSLQLQALQNEHKMLQQQIKGTQENKVQIATCTEQPPSHMQAQSPQSAYIFDKGIQVSAMGQCRVMAYCQDLGILAVSQPFASTSLLAGFGVKIISCNDMRSCQYIGIHNKEIRALAFNPQQDNLLLSASMDNHVNITSVITNNVVQKYDAGKQVWSCCWNQDNPTYFYAGLMNGVVLAYDTRNTRSFVSQLRPPAGRSCCPVASLMYIPLTAGCNWGGLMVGTLEGAIFWEKKSDKYQPHCLPAEQGTSCMDIQVDPFTKNYLLSYRPSRNVRQVRHVLMELNGYVDLASSEVEFSSNTLQTFHAGASSKFMSKSSLFPSPSGDGLLVCAGDEALQSTLVWHARSPEVLQTLQANQPVRDICPIEINQKHYLATLTEKTLKMYKWKSQ
uniref:E3 ubiquitin-protein ligase RFWD3 n=1 Tax=Myxine glutinosa TaxID=7769 RepID=UPI00358FA679